MATLSFFGAVGNVTGSRFLLEIDHQRLLIDCGMFQGPKENRLRNWDQFPVKPNTINRVLLTHAHIDHIGYVPRLVSQGFGGPVHCTYPTADLSKILLLDSAHIQEEDAEWANKKGFSRHKPAKPLFDTKETRKALLQFKPVHYGEQLDVTGSVRVKFKDSGHLLGSSFIDVRALNGKRRRKILFCGDLGRPGRALLRDPVQVYDVDYLVLESTYGDRLHGDANFHEEFARIINESVDRGGVLIIPSFAVGRTQTLLYLLRQFEEEGKIPSIPVYIDSPMALDALDIYEKRVADQNLASRTLAIKGTDLYRTRDLHLADTREQSKAISNIRGNAIIIASSGMVTAGRVLHHLTQRLPDASNTVMFVGYQAAGTRGRAMVDGETSVKIHGRRVEIKAKIENLKGLSGHADYDETLAWLMGFNRPPEKVFIVHGEPEASQSLADKIHDRYGWEVEIPGFEDSYEIDL